MKLISHSIFLAAFYVSSVCFAETESTSNGLDRMLRGAHIGASFGEFVAAHPDARYSDEDIRDLSVASDRPAALLLTHESDPFLGVTAFANIGFKEGRLYELVAVWADTAENIHARRRRFFTAVIQRHGHAYLRETILVHPHTPEERPAAVFLWEGKSATVLAFHTAPSPLAPHPKATLTYALFTPGDPFLDDILEKHPATDGQHERAWDALDDIIPMLEALE